MIPIFAAAAALLLAAPTGPSGATTRPAPTGPAVVADSGEFVRASFVDGYGSQAGSVAFVRRPGEEPRVEVRTAAGDALTMIVPLATWNRVQAAARFFDRTLVPVTQEDSICLHAWSVSVEAGNRAGPDGPAVVRKARQSGCDDGLALSLAFEMARQAVEALPSCALLAARQYRNDVTRLAECGLLEGDRAAAALARNAFGSDWFQSPRGDRTAYAIRQLFFEDARLDWAGTIAQGGEAAARLWSNRLEGASLFVRRIVGETADRVRMEGMISRYVDNGHIRAPVTIIWTRENGFDFRVRSATIGMEQPDR